CRVQKACGCVNKIAPEQERIVQRRPKEKNIAVADVRDRRPTLRAFQPHLTFRNVAVQFAMPDRTIRPTDLYGGISRIVQHKRMSGGSEISLETDYSE